MKRERRKRYHPRGTQPGTLAAHAEGGGRAGPDHVVPVRREPVRGADGFPLRDLLPVAGRRGGVLWLDVCGLSDPSVVRAIATASGSTPWRSRTF